jgi:hypothetical protein
MGPAGQWNRSARTTERYVKASRRDCATELAPVTLAERPLRFSVYVSEEQDVTMTLLDDYSGDFEPNFDLTRLSRPALAVLGREWLLHGHLQDRIGMPLVLAGHSREEMERIAIAEWMGASPVYTRRMQRALGFAGTGVDTIFKGLQLDIGSPHAFMDFRYRLHDRDHGEFWLAHCGALMDVEPMGPDFVHGMCHTIEDPTFDATAVATNPRAQVRPVHRPPRIPADRSPHCHWRVTIDEANDPVTAHPNVAEVESSRVAAVEVAIPDANLDTGGWDDYGGAFDPDFQLEDLSHRALAVCCQEVAIESHLLFRSYLLALSQAFGPAEPRALGPRVFTGLGGLTAQRLHAAMGTGQGGAGIAKLFQLHPMFWPRTYVDLDVQLEDRDRVRVALRACPALDEGDELTWFAGLGGPSDRGLNAMAQAVDPRARCVPVRLSREERFACEIVIDPDAEPAMEPDEVVLAKFSTGSAFDLSPRRRLLG